MEELVEINLNPQITSSFDFNQLEEVLFFAQTEQTRIKRIISLNINHQSDDKEIRHYVKMHQVGLIEILNALMKTIEATDIFLKTNSLNNEKELLGVQKAIYIILEDVLCYIGFRYNRYCNPGINISEKYKCLFFRKSAKEIYEIEGSGLSICSELLEIGLSPIKTHQANEKARLTYGDILFYNELLRVVKDVVKVSNDEEYENELIRALIFVNFNNIRFVQYCVKRMKVALEKRFQIVDKIELLALCLKRINQTPIRRGLALHRNNPSIKTLLSQWVLEEICFWEKKLQLQAPFGKNTNYLVDTNIKIVTELSVSQLACFIRLFVETGTITNKRKEDIFEYYVKHYQSKKVESIEYGSFRSKYYGIKELTKESVKDLLIKMLNELRKL